MYVRAWTFCGGLVEELVVRGELRREDSAISRRVVFGVERRE